MICGGKQSLKKSRVFLFDRYFAQGHYIYRTSPCAMTSPPYSRTGLPHTALFSPVSRGGYLNGQRGERQRFPVERKNSSPRRPAMREALRPSRPPLARACTASRCLQPLRTRDNNVPCKLHTT
eukprot:3744133-Prymnesium_polylepis.1